MKAGETCRFDCPSCSVEFEVTFEPKAKGDRKAAAKTEESEPVEHCPFCGSSIAEDE